MNKPIVSIIVAIAKNGVIGKGNELPWDLPADLAYFKSTTEGHPVIMGARTHFSIGMLLPGRKNIVLSDDSSLKLIEGAIMADSFEKAFELADDNDEAFIIGGANVYKQGLNFADRLYITEVDADVEGDVLFPEFDKSLWKEVSRERREADEKNAYPLNFLVYEKIKN